MNRELSTCCLCGRKYMGWGNSTWGYWDDCDENDPKGEKMRCCDDCNAYKVIPARIRKYKVNNKQAEK